MVQGECMLQRQSGLSPDPQRTPAASMGLLARRSWDFLTLQPSKCARRFYSYLSSKSLGCLRDSSPMGNNSFSLPSPKIIFLFTNNIQAQKLCLTSLSLMWWKSMFTLNGLFQITEIYLIRLHYALSSILTYKKKGSAQGFEDHCSCASVLRT